MELSCDAVFEQRTKNCQIPVLPRDLFLQRPPFRPCTRFPVGPVVTKKADEMSDFVMTMNSLWESSKTCTCPPPAQSRQQFGSFDLTCRKITFRRQTECPFGMPHFFGLPAGFAVSPSSTLVLDCDAFGFGAWTFFALPLLSFTIFSSSDGRTDPRSGYCFCCFVVAPDPSRRNDWCVCSLQPLFQNGLSAHCQPAWLHPSQWV